MIKASHVQEDLEKNFKNDGSLLKEFGTITTFASNVITGITSTSTGNFVGTVISTAGAAISACVLIKERFAKIDTSLVSSVTSSYSKFRVIFYVECQRCYFESLSEVIKINKKLFSKSVAAHSKFINDFKIRAANISDAEIRFHYSVNPASSEIQLYTLYSQWLQLVLEKVIDHEYEAFKIIHQIEFQARERLSLSLSGNDDVSTWMRNYLALEQNRRISHTLSSLDKTLTGWLSEKAELRQAQQESWEIYKKMLVQLPDAKESMFNEDFGVRKVFVPPSVNYHRALLSGTPDKFDEINDLGRLLGALLSNRPSSEDLIFLCGGPGSGKSTLCRMLASELAKRENVHPVFIRLKRFKESIELSSFIEDYMAKEGLIAKLSDLKNIPNVVFILDGFDELVMASVSRLRYFFSVLQEDLRTGPLRTTKAIISGRDTLFPMGKGLPRGSHVINIRAFDEVKVKKWGEKWRKTSSKEEAQSFYPEKFISNQTYNQRNLSPLHHLVTWPLTLHLVARAHTSGKLILNDEAAHIEKSYLYREILADTAMRQSEQTQGDGRLPPEKMRGFLHEVAWEMYIRSLDSMEPEDVIPILGKFVETPKEKDLIELAEIAIVNSPEIHKGEDTGFEFVHKSFAEFLVAEKIAMTIANVIYKIPNLEGVLDWRYDNEYSAGAYWDIFSRRLLTSEVQEMLEPMIGCWMEFQKGVSSNDIEESQAYKTNLRYVADRSQELYSDAVCGNTLNNVISKITGKRDSNPFEFYSNYLAGIVLIATASIRRLNKLEDNDLAKFNGEVWNSAFWRFLMMLGAGGLQLDQSLSSRLLKGISVPDNLDGLSVSECTTPIPNRQLLKVSGFKSGLNDEFDENFEVLLSLLLHSTKLQIESIIVSRQAQSEHPTNPMNTYEVLISIDAALRKIRNTYRDLMRRGISLKKIPEFLEDFLNQFSRFRSVVHKLLYAPSDEIEFDKMRNILDMKDIFHYPIIVKMLEDDEKPPF